MLIHHCRRLAPGGCAVAVLVALGSAVAWAAPLDDAERELPPPPPPHADSDGMPPLPERPPAAGEAPPPRPGLLLWDRMSEPEREKFRQFLAENFPDRFDELTDLEEHDPPQFRMFIGRILPEMRRLRELREKDPELFGIRKQEMETEFQLRRLSRRYRFAKEENKPELEKEIRTLVEKHFDLRTQREAKELSRLETRLTQLRKRSESRTNDRDKLIAEIVADVLAGRPPRPGPGDRGGERLGAGEPGDPPPDGPVGDAPPRERVRRPRTTDTEGDRPARERRPGRRRGGAAESPKPAAEEEAPAHADEP